MSIIIDNSTIDEMAMALITKIGYAINEIDVEEDKEWALRCVYEIQGICELAEELKGALRV